MLKKLREFVKAYRKPLLILLAILLFIFVSTYLGLDKKAVAIIAAAGLYVAQAFTGFLGVLALIPVFGPLIVKVITLPFFLIVNGIAYILTFFAIKGGNSRKVFESRILVTIFLLGIIVGFILGRLI